MNKPENTTENKKRFFAQYYGLPVMKNSDHPKYSAWMVDAKSLREYEPADYLELRSVESLTDEECRKILELNPYHRKEHITIIDEKSIGIANGIFGFWYSYGGNRYNWHQPIDGLTARASDLFRGMGVLVPFNGLSTTDLIDYGWAKIKEVKP